jgi:ABC-type multidrug transport system fused ATPase/permease subunit
MGVTSLAAGAVEAMLLVVITRIALAITEGRTTLGLLAGHRPSVGTAIAFAAILVIVRLVLALLTMRLNVTLAVNVGADVRTDVADAYLHASWATQQAEGSGRLQEMLISFAGSASGVANAFGVALNAGLSLLALFVGSLLINPIATVVVVVALTVLGSALAPIRRRVRTRGTEAAEAQMEFATSIAEMTSLGLEMQAFGVRDQFTAETKRLIERQAQRQTRSQLTVGLLSPAYTALAFSALVGGLALASALQTGELGGAAAVMLVMMRSLSYGQSLQSAAGQLASTLPYLDEIDRSIRRYRSEPAPSGSIEIDRVGALRSADVSFAYTGDRPVLQDLDFTIAPGEIMGVVGPSGGGKSTLVQLLLGLRQPSNGRVTVGGVDLADVDRRSWSRLVAFVAQDSVLASGTVEQNIAFFRSDIGRDDVEQAAKDANILDEVRAMPDGMQTQVGQGGALLSGGQRQRIAIARALAGAPELLVMDEPTSALDVRSEQLVREAIVRLKGRVTVVLIAHRLSTLDVCDRIMVVQNGTISAMGTAEELKRDDHFFRESLEIAGLKP